MILQTNGGSQRDSQCPRLPVIFIFTILMKTNDVTQIKPAITIFYSQFGSLVEMFHHTQIFMNLSIVR